MTTASRSQTSFYRLMLQLSLPIASQQMLSAGINLIDTLMISRLGDTHVAAVSISNQIYFFLVMAMIGVASGSSVLVSQYWGRSDLKRIHASQGLCLFAGLGFGLAFGISSFLFPSFLISLFTDDPLVIDYGADYLRILSFGFIFYPVTVSFTSCLNSTHHAVTPLIVSTIALTANAFLNYCLIFGNFGFPEMGIVGAAYATSGARVLECVLMLLATYGMGLPASARLRDLISTNRNHFRQYVKICAPVLVNELLYALGVSVYKYVYAQLGTQYLSAVAVVQVIEKFSFVLLAGIASACAIMVGNNIGSGLLDEARLTSKRFISVIMVVASAIGMILFVFSGAIVSVFGLTESSAEIASNILKMFSIIGIFRAVSMLFNIGILRGGGDTKVALYIDLGGIWLIGVPLSLLAAFVFELNIYLVYLCVSLDVVTQAVVCLLHYRRDRWINEVAH